LLQTGPRPRPPPLPYTTLVRSAVRIPNQVEHQASSLIGIDPAITGRNRRGKIFAVSEPLVVTKFVVVLLGRLFVGEWAVFVFDLDRKSTRLNSSHVKISYAVFC